MSIRLLVLLIVPILGSAVEAKASLSSSDKEGDQSIRRGEVWRERACLGGKGRLGRGTTQWGECLFRRKESAVLCNLFEGGCCSV